MTPSPRRPRLAVGLLLAGLVAGLTGCASSSANTAAAPAGTAAPAATDAAAPSTGESITLYNAQHKQTTAALVAAFTKQTGIAVKETDKDDGELTAQVEEEGANSPADVFYSENSPYLAELAGKNLLAKVDPATLAAVPAGAQAADGTWVGVSERVSALVYDPDKITPDKLPQSVMDMADPKYKGQFEIAPGETDFEPVVASVAKAKGDAAAVTWLKAIKDNAGEKGSVPDYDTLTSDVSQGITDFALINHYYYYRLKETVANGTAPAKLAYFAQQDPGYLALVSGAAVLASSKHAAAAQKFLSFLTSELGQSILAGGYSFEYPVRAGVAPNPALPPLSTYQPNSFTAADLGDSSQVKDLLTKAGMI